MRRPRAGMKYEDKRMLVVHAKVSTVEYEKLQAFSRSSGTPMGRLLRESALAKIDELENA